VRRHIRMLISVTSKILGKIQNHLLKKPNHNT
jgi:hypothetical protein